MRVRRRRASGRSKVVFQPWVGMNEAPTHMPQHTQGTLQCLFNLLRNFLNLCDLCNTNELWAINDGFKASECSFVNYVGRGGRMETQWEMVKGCLRCVGRPQGRPREKGMGKDKGQVRKENGKSGWVKTAEGPPSQSGY